MDRIFDEQGILTVAAGEMQARVFRPSIEKLEAGVNILRVFVKI
jgi:hypothetical protein